MVTLLVLLYVIGKLLLILGVVDVQLELRTNLIDGFVLWRDCSLVAVWAGLGADKMMLSGDDVLSMMMILVLSTITHHLPNTQSANAAPY